MYSGAQEKSGVISPVDQIEGDGPQPCMIYLKYLFLFAYMYNQMPTFHCVILVTYLKLLSCLVGSVDEVFQLVSPGEKWDPVLQRTTSHACFPDEPKLQFPAGQCNFQVPILM